MVSSPRPHATQDREALVAAATRLRAEVQRRIVGQEQVLDEILMSLIAGGHALLVGVPGLAKTLMVRSLAEAVDGLVLSNTTTARDGLRSARRDEAGGLSGRLLRSGMLDAVRRARELAPSLPIMASGGMFTGQDVADAYAAGADLVQLWTGLVYRGPGLLGEAALVRHQRA